MTISFLQLVDLFKANLGGIIAALILSPLAIWITKRTGLLDIPGSQFHKQHAQPTPLAGGVVLALSSVILLTVFRLWQSPFTALLVATAIVFAFGVWDDARGLSAPQKLIGQVLASVLLIVSGTSVHFLDGLNIAFLGPGLIKVLNWGITVFWLVGIANSINMVDSMDGLATGIAGIAFAFFMGMALVAQQGTLAMFSAVFLGICIGLYIFNVSPAKLFLGDSGAQTLGFILAAVAIIYAPDNLPQGSSWFVPIMVLGVPIFDTVLVVVSRLIRRKPVFHADLAHTYHRLVALGLDPNRAVLVIHLTALILNFLAFIALSLPPLMATIIFSSVVFASVIFLAFLEFKKPDVVRT
jgi:UDP-GlcNAc:undecaprenyl-phosphate/decaprenyl-phosphate GlcNAc-1-phosphate transferase